MADEEFGQLQNADADYAELVYLTHSTANGLSLGPENMTELLKELSGRTADINDQSIAGRIENTIVRKIDMMWLEK